MEKVSSSIMKKANKNTKSKKKQPLKVVYIGNPIKFNTTASEFRALVQELTGRDSDSSPSGSLCGSGEGEAVKAEDDDSVCAHAPKVLGHHVNGRMVENKLNFEPYSDAFYSALMDSNLDDVLKSFDGV